MLTVLRHPTDQGFTSACRVATGRSAILHMARRWKPDKVFMPSYVPEGIINPFIESRAQIIFYKLTDTLAPALMDLREKVITATSRSIVVAIEYFGYPACYGALRGELPGFEGLVFVDCAHSLFSHPYYDVKLSVFNKVIAVTDGAAIYSRVPELDLTLDDRALPQIPTEALNAYEDHLRANGTITTSEEASDVEVAVLESAMSYEKYYQIISKNMEPWAQSSASRIIEGATDWSTLARQRKRKSEMIRHSTPKRMSIRHDTPAQFAHPIRCHGRREEMVDALSNIGVVAGALNERWDHIPSDRGFDFEREFIDDHLLLPTGEDVDVMQLMKICSTLKKFK